MYLDVIVDITNSQVDRIFEYFTDDESIKVGSRVIVPFGSKQIEGYVINEKKECSFDPDKVKKVIRSFGENPVLSEECIRLAEYVSSRYYVTKALALRLFLPSEMRRGTVKEKLINRIYYVEGNIDERLANLKKTAKNQEKALIFMSGKKIEDAAELNKTFGRSSIVALLEKGYLAEKAERDSRSPYTDLDLNKKSVVLTEKQNAVISGILNSEKQVSLIHGVTGSGKTEIYLSLIKKTIDSGKTAIMLVPEIALTPQMLSQLRARFGDSAAILHSGLSAGERYDEWWRLKSGRAKIAIGARSAIFAPLTDLGIIVIDEEHDGSYQSESAPRFNTIEIARKRAQYNNCKVILGSATPSLESYYAAKSGEYELFELPERINKRPMPEVFVADMRQEVRSGNNSAFSSLLRREIKRCLENNNQAIIFLNQRGYSKNVICTECGYVPKCESCDVSLTYHSDEDVLKCHYCGAKFKMIKSCPNCGSKFLRYGSLGTQRVVSELQKLFPEAKIVRLDRDSSSKKDGHKIILEEFAKRKADILVGTQMIAKGHDFPSVTLVGILDGDMSLHFSDFRSGERTFQLLTQVAGRCGRAGEKGVVVLQTYSPTNNILRFAASYDYKEFFNYEISLRKATGFPPFTDIVRVLINGESEAEVAIATKAIYGETNKIVEKNREKFHFYGCMKAPLKRLQNKFRYQILMRIDKDDRKVIDDIAKVCLSNTNKKVSVFIEENPNNLS